MFGTVWACDLARDSLDDSHINITHRLFEPDPGPCHHCRNPTSLQLYIYYVKDALANHSFLYPILSKKLKRSWPERSRVGQITWLPGSYGPT